MMDNVSVFLQDVHQRCEDWGVELELHPKTHIKYGEGTGICKVNGYFSDDSEGDIPKLAVAIGKDPEMWLPVLVHEYCHMRQWHKQIPEWVNCEVFGESPYELLDRWISREIELDPPVLEEVIDKIMTLELDCEKRAVKMIKKYKLPLDRDLYIQKANAYVCFYNLVAQERKWYTPGREPYNIPEIVAQMPTNFDYTLCQPPLDDIMNALELCL